MNKNHSNKIRALVMCAMLASLTCVATMIIKVPSPLHGYVNLGDCIVLLGAWVISPIPAFFSAAVGSSLADVFSGYATYAPATFVIKGLMALVACFSYKLISKKLKRLPSRIIAGFLAELLMVGGYLVFESFLYGFVPSLANVPANAVQGVAGIIFGILLTEVFERYKLVTE